MQIFGRTNVSPVQITYLYIWFVSICVQYLSLKISVTVAVNLNQNYTNIRTPYFLLSRVHRCAKPACPTANFGCLLAWNSSIVWYQLCPSMSYKYNWKISIAISGHVGATISTINESVCNALMFVCPLHLLMEDQKWLFTKSDRHIYVYVTKSSCLWAVRGRVGAVNTLGLLLCGVLLTPSWVGSTQMNILESGGGYKIIPLHLFLTESHET